MKAAVVVVALFPVRTIEASAAETAPQRVSGFCLQHLQSCWALDSRRGHVDGQVLAGRPLHLMRLHQGESVLSWAPTPY